MALQVLQALVSAAVQSSTPAAAEEQQVAFQLQRLINHSKNKTILRLLSEVHVLRAELAKCRQRLPEQANGCTASASAATQCLHSLQSTECLQQVSQACPVCTVGE